MHLAAPVIAVLSAVSACAAGLDSLRERSPFVPPAAPQQTEANALSTVELTGILSVGGKPQFSVRDTSTGRSFWLGLGETMEGLTARSYDEAASSVVIEGRGTRRNIVIREARVTTAAPPPPVVTAAPQQFSSNQPPVVAAAQPAVQSVAPSQKKEAQALLADAKSRSDAEKERDARLLVSDLMELSVMERKRYEENQRRRAAGLPRLDPNEPLPEGTP